ncbi:hypothetical protein KAK07_22505 [Ideonella sp. 4Y16]|uniref:Uncharacterized protein n=1 Tax=Ideonella alba TaxID=2824118 RepID=A0A940YCD9_9BURK|nr:hypothetical protein [Ideonella alba]MBQ0930072.1 hypothetical protein [Ideonella alba]MBQ0946132.1 hypothetical protein [Ideonella alba]
MTRSALHPLVDALLRECDWQAEPDGPGRWHVGFAAGEAPVAGLLLCEDEPGLRWSLRFLLARRLTPSQCPAASLALHRVQAGFSPWVALDLDEAHGLVQVRCGWVAGDDGPAAARLRRALAEGMAAVEAAAAALAPLAA